MKKKSKSKVINQTRVITQLIICLVIIATATFTIVNKLKSSEIIEESPFVESVVDDNVDPTDVTEDPNKIIYETLSQKTASKFDGELMLVNWQNEYYGFNEDLINVEEQLSNDEVDYLVSNSSQIMLRENVYINLRDMAKAFYEATGIDDLVVFDGYRTFEEQEALYNDDLEATGLERSERVAEAGFSEHQTGYAIDFTTSSTWDYDGQGDYAWIDANCWEYGFILRYPENKESITNIMYEPWHYRYVGVPHAYYMSANNLTLEEYIALIKNYTYEEGALEVKYGNTRCEIYYFEADNSGDYTYIPVPSGKKYEVSGNNSTGFIITTYPEIDEVHIQPQPTEESTTEEVTTEKSELDESSNSDEE